MSRWQRDVPIYNQPLISAPFLFFGVLALIGLSFSAVRLFTGLSFTGMNDQYAWGVWKTFNVMTLTALGSGALSLGIFGWLFNQKQLHVVMRTALASSILFYATGMFALVFDVGRPWNMWNMMLPWRWNVHSALLEVAVCMSAYVAIFLLYENLPTVADTFYVKGSPERRKTMDRWIPRLRSLYPFMLGFAYLLPAMHQSSLGSLMVIAGPKVHPLWQTQMLPALYLIQAVVCGFASVLLILLIGSLAWRRALDVPIIGDLAKFMAWTSIFFVVVRWIDVLVRGVAGLAFEQSWYALLFHGENLLVLLPALLLLNGKLRRIPRVVFVTSIFTALGGLLYRFSPTTFAFRAGDPSIYFPTMPELLMCLGYIGLAVTLFILAAKLFAIMPAPLSEWYASVKFNKQIHPELRIDDHGAATDH
jgi:Ni/Fe-hydrogenase subunit HybB-like protein